MVLQQSLGHLWLVFEWQTGAELGRILAVLRKMSQSGDPILSKLGSKKRGVFALGQTIPTDINPQFIFNIASFATFGCQSAHTITLHIRL